MGEYVPVRPRLWRTAGEAAAFLRSGRGRRRGIETAAGLPGGEGRAVLLLPVIGRGDRHTVEMRGALESLGYRAFGWGLGTNVGPTPEALAGMEARLVGLFEAHGPMDVVGFSLGGVFARLLAHRRPAMVRQVATVCSPFRATVDSAFLPLRPFVPLWRTPDLVGMSALAARPLPVPGTFVFSRRDGIVAWESCVEPGQPEDCFEIAGPHVTITRDAEVLGILARRLGREVG